MAKKFEEYELKDVVELAVRDWAFNSKCPECNGKMGFRIYDGKQDGKPQSSRMCYDCNMKKKDGNGTTSVDVPTGLDF